MRTLSDQELKRIKVAFGLYLEGLMKKTKTDIKSLHEKARMSAEYINDMLCGLMIASISAGKKIAKALELSPEERLFWILIRADYSRVLDPSETEVVASNFPELFPHFLASDEEEKTDQDDSAGVSESRREFLLFLAALASKKCNDARKAASEKIKKRALKDLDDDPEVGQREESSNEKEKEYPKRSLGAEDRRLLNVPVNKKPIVRKWENLFLIDKMHIATVDIKLSNGNIGGTICETKEFQSSDEAGIYRHINCIAYDVCLDKAAKLEWNGFSCKFCRHFMDPEMNCYKDSMEVPFGSFDLSRCS